MRVLFIIGIPCIIEDIEFLNNGSNTRMELVEHRTVRYFCLGRQDGIQEQ
jgi:hypothetical protein